MFIQPNIKAICRIDMEFWYFQMTFPSKVPILQDFQACKGLAHIVDCDMRYIESIPTTCRWLLLPSESSIHRILTLANCAFAITHWAIHCHKLVNSLHIKNKSCKFENVILLCGRGSLNNKVAKHARYSRNIIAKAQRNYFCCELIIRIWCYGRRTWILYIESCQEVLFLERSTWWIVETMGR